MNAYEDGLDAQNTFNTDDVRGEGVENDANEDE